MSINVVTCYHREYAFVNKYCLLLESLSSTLSEIGNDGRVILVANGLLDGAPDPEQILSEFGSRYRDKFHFVKIPKNLNYANGLNTALREVVVTPSLVADWIGSIQPNVILSAGWISAILEQMRRAGSASAGFGRLVRQDWSTVWGNGHFLISACVSQVDESVPGYAFQISQNRIVFPCLSAVLFRHSVVAQVIQRYGDFVSEQLDMYGDCVDVAFRCREIGQSDFLYCKEGVASKQLSSIDVESYLVAQLVIAARYFQRFDEVADRIRRLSKWTVQYEGIVREARACLGKSYSLNGVSAPAGRQWGDPERWI